MREEQAHMCIYTCAKLMHVFWDVWDGVSCGLWWKSVLENRVLAPQNINFLPAAQPWWAAGCAVTEARTPSGGAASARCGASAKPSSTRPVRVLGKWLMFTGRYT